MERNSEGSANPRKRSLEEDKNEEQEGEDDVLSEEEDQDDEEFDEGIVLAGLENDTIRLVRHRKSRKSIPKPNMPFQKRSWINEKTKRREPKHAKSLTNHQQHHNARKSAQSV